MSMCGELENLDYELLKAEQKVSKIKVKIAAIKELMKKDKQNGNA
tara:strand:- start:79 stop:213 length:135 start_codon:yes stop_codon:yes gene_type:complete